MKLIINESTNPTFNLALEEYLLAGAKLELIMLWRNNKAVIIGNNQNTFEELDMDFVKDKGITVVRRQSGGGAVFHDLGNINFTMITKVADDDFANYNKFTAPICEFLKTLGINAEQRGRNDVVIGDAKFSGNAQAVKSGRIMHHGTILFNADFSDLASALKPHTAKIESKGIKSVRARVTNVASHLKEPMTVEVFFDKLAGYFRDNVPQIEMYDLSDDDIKATDKLVREKYSTWEWNFGKSPSYTYQKQIKFTYGLVDVKLTANGGIIEEMHIFGDFFGTKDKSELENLLKGARHEPDAIAEIIATINLSDYIHGMTPSDFLQLLQ